MQKQILTEIRELKSLISKVIGTSDQFPDNPFSTDALDRASREFERLSIQRGNWVKERDIQEHIKSAPWRCGKFIREEFGFQNYFKRGREYYYWKNDLIALGKELIDRKVDLRSYVELKEDQAKFEKYVNALLNNITPKGKRKPYKLPTLLKGIQSTPPKMPDPEVIRTDLKNLKAEFFKNKYGDYIDIYRGNYARIKEIYWMEKYIEPNLRKRLNSWRESFNLANDLLKKITKKKEVFIPIQEDEMIRL